MMYNNVQILRGKGKLKKLALYGHGYVGKAFEELANKHYELIIKDPALNKLPSQKELAEPEIAIVCVPTQPNSDGSCDVSIVLETVRNVPQRYVLIKSTIEPGTTEKLIKETGEFAKSGYRE